MWCIELYSAEIPCGIQNTQNSDIIMFSEMDDYITDRVLFTGNQPLHTKSLGSGNSFHMFWNPWILYLQSVKDHWSVSAWCKHVILTSKKILWGGTSYDVRPDYCRARMWEWSTVNCQLPMKTNWQPDKLTNSCRAPFLVTLILMDQLMNPINLLLGEFLIFGV